MKQEPLMANLSWLVLFYAGVVIGARLMGRQGACLLEFYMLTPALAAFVPRLFF